MHYSWNKIWKCKKSNLGPKTHLVRAVCVYMWTILSGCANHKPADYSCELHFIILPGAITFLVSGDFMTEISTRQAISRNWEWEFVETRDSRFCYLSHYGVVKDLRAAGPAECYWVHEPDMTCRQSFQPTIDTSGEIVLAGIQSLAVNYLENQTFRDKHTGVLVLYTCQS